VGAGIIESKAEKLLYQLATRNNIPVTSTLRGLGCFPPNHPLYIGMIGMHGTKYANQLMEEADVVIALGVRFDDRATGKLNEFCKNATLIHVDIDKSEINKLKIAHLSIHANVKEVIRQILPGIAENRRLSWSQEVEFKKGELPYVEASRAMGGGNAWIIFGHILPNILTPSIVYLTLLLGDAILYTAAFGFLGVGIDPSTPEWGAMLSGGRDFLLNGKWWITVFPGAMIFLAVLSFNLLGDGLREAVDSKLRL